MLPDRLSLLRLTAVAGLLALGLAGCGQMRTTQTVEAFEATLAGAQEVPPVATAGSGRAEVQYDRANSMMQWTVTYSGLSGPVTGAHIHGPAGPGVNAPVAVGFGGNLNAQPIRGEAKITPQQADQLATGQWYVNLHTAANPGGEIRGQLRPRR